MKLLMIATSHAGSCALGHPTGLWLEELAVPYYAFMSAGIEVAIASVEGGAVPLDPLSLELRADTPDEVGRFIVDPSARDMVGESRKIEDVDADAYQALFLPGGYGAMWDLPGHQMLGRILAGHLVADRPVAAVGHGVAGLAACGGAVTGRVMSCFSDAEETALGLCEYVPFLLETRLREMGAVVETGQEFSEFVRRDRYLITGQNPASTRLVTETLLSALG